MSLRRTLAALSVALAAATFAAGEIRAETPQALGLVATATPTPMPCRDGLCTAYLSAFCLEEHRKSPQSHTAYRLAERTEVTLLVETAAGDTLRLSGREWLGFQTRTLFTGVEASLDQARLATLNPVRLSVEVGPLATLLPVVAADAKTAHSAEEIALATGPLRRSAERHFEGNAEMATAVSITANLIGSLPKAGTISEERRIQTMIDAFATLETIEAGEKTRAVVGGIVRTCERHAHYGVGTMRQCLELKHSGLQAVTNREFWDSLGDV